jgi:Putative Actinobacterial Holin-X, holin superfamily III
MAPVVKRVVLRVLLVSGSILLPKGFRKATLVFNGGAPIAGNGECNTFGDEKSHFLLHAPIRSRATMNLRCRSTAATGSARGSRAGLSSLANQGEIARSQAQDTERSGFDTVVVGLVRDVRTLVRQEMALARHEVQYEIGKILKAVLWCGIALVLAVIGLFVTAAACVLLLFENTGLPAWACPFASSRYEPSEP